MAWRSDRMRSGFDKLCELVICKPSGKRPLRWEHPEKVPLRWWNRSWILNNKEYAGGIPGGSECEWEANGDNLRNDLGYGGVLSPKADRSQRHSEYLSFLSVQRSFPLPKMKSIFLVETKSLWIRNSCPLLYLSYQSERITSAWLMRGFCHPDLRDRLDFGKLVQKNPVRMTYKIEITYSKALK